MDNRNSPFISELHSSPQIVLAIGVIAGIIIYFIGDSVRDGTRLQQFSLLIFTLTGSTWLLSSHWPKLGAWLTVLLLTILVLLADYWLQIQGARFLLSIPPVLAMVTLGFHAAIVASLLETILLLGIVSITSTREMNDASMLVIMLLALAGILYLWQRRSWQLSEWSWGYYKYALAVLQSARSERMEHKQLETDLLLANRELARLSSWLKAMHQAAEEARQAKEQFVANVSHELRTPLNMIIGFSDIISRSSSVYGVRLPPTLLADIAAIQRNSQHLASLVDDVLDLSQIESSRMVLSKEWTSLAEIVDQAILAVQSLYVSKQLYLKRNVPCDLPLVYCDSTRIRQVLINLLSNAGRFTEEGGVCVTVRCGQDAVVIGVADTGLGISPDDQTRIFEPFYQVDGSLRRSYGGSGLGLNISKQLVEMHRGKMWLESELGVGTTFYFSLPLESPSPLPSSTTSGTRYNPYAQFVGRTEQSKAPVPQIKPRVVVLEEGDTLSRMFTRYHENIEVISIPDTTSALQELSLSPALALIVNDASFSTPPIIREQLTALPYSTPIFRCWVADENSSIQSLGITRYLVKPVTCSVLLSTLEELGDHIETVLLVDDDREVLQLFTRMLVTTVRPYKVLQTTNGQRALSLLRERRPDVVILDLMMPKMDGFQILEEKQKDASISQIPVIVVSAKNPLGQPIVSHHFSVTYQNGLSAYELITCVQVISEVLSPGTSFAGQVHPKKRTV